GGPSGPFAGGAVSWSSLGSRDGHGCLAPGHFLVGWLAHQGVLVRWVVCRRRPPCSRSILVGAWPGRAPTGRRKSVSFRRQVRGQRQAIRGSAKPPGFGLFSSGFRRFWQSL